MLAKQHNFITDDIYCTDTEYNISNRRYLGNKTKLLRFIDSVIKKENIDFYSFCDLFAGTGVVGNHFNTENVGVISNDFLKSNYTCLEAFLGTEKVDKQKVYEHIDYLNNLKLSENYFSNNFGGKFFNLQDAKKIGTIRQEIDDMVLSQRMKAILLASLLYSADKIANTVGHYDAYRKADFERSGFHLNPIVIQNNVKNIAFCADVNRLVREIKADVFYLDPPYNSRQYSDSYHLLENLITWKKPDVFGVASKMDRTHIKSLYCSRNAVLAFKDLIENINGKYILVSYNDTGKKANSRSNALISDSDIMEILSTKGKVSVHKLPHKAFSTGKTDFKSVCERLFVCKVF